MTVLSPFVYWAQSEKNLFIKVDLKDVKDPEINIENRKLEFRSKGLGAKGLHDYGFSIDFKDEIKIKESNYKVTDNRVDFVLIKSSKGWWPRLTSHPQKPFWLKVDFDRWQSEDDLNDEEVRDIREDYPDLYERLKAEEFGYKKEDIKKVYMSIYNLVMFVGFLYIVAVLCIKYIRHGPHSLPETYAAVGPAMCFLQLLQFLEVMHPMFGYVKGGVFMPLLQVTGRAFVLFGNLEQEPRLQTKPVVFYLFLTWSAIEVIRYPYYMSQIYKRENGLLTWLRYTAWIILYPVGFVCESVIIFRNLLYVQETDKWSIYMPNKLNFTFHYPTFLRIYLMALLLPGIIALMSHMYKVRKQKLGPRGGKSKHS